MTTTEVGFGLRYAPNEKFFQQRRQRRSLPSDGWFMGMDFTAGLKNIMGGDYGYRKLSLYAYKEFWIAPYGKIIANINADKIWGQTSFPSLLTPNANSSYTIQAGSFNLLNPMEFVNDQALTWDIHYRMGGWLLNRIPLLKYLHLREVFGFRGYWGKLSDRNNPEFNSNLLVFPSDVYSLEKAPYMEINVGVENILNLFRIDYVRRLNYLDLPDVLHFRSQGSVREDVDRNRAF